MNELIEGLKNLKTGAIASLISITLLVASVIATIIVAIGLTKIQNPQTIIAAISIAELFSILIFISLILGVIGFIMYFIATGHLKEYDPNLRVGRIGMILQIVGLLFVLLVSILIYPIVIINSGSLNGLTTNPANVINETTLASSMFVGLVSLISIGFLIIVIGSILFGLMLIRLGSDVESKFKAAGIIYLLGIILSVFGGIGGILGIISNILIYLGAKDSLKKLEA